MAHSRGGKASKRQSLHCSENSGLFKGQTTHLKDSSPVGFPHRELTRSPGAARLWDPPLPAAGKGRSTGTVGVRVIRASRVMTACPDQPQAGTSSWAPPGDCPSSYFWGSPSLCSQGMPAASHVPQPRGLSHAARRAQAGHAARNVPR